MHIHTHKQTLTLFVYNIYGKQGALSFRAFRESPGKQLSVANMRVPVRSRRVNSQVLHTYIPIRLTLILLDTI